MANFPSRTNSASSPFVIQDDHKFNNSLDRDTYFGSNKDELIKDSTLVMTSDHPQLWTGDTNPAVYSNTHWSDASFIIKGDKGDPCVEHVEVDKIKQDIQSLQTADQVLQSNINQKIAGIHVEDVDNNAFDDITALHFVNATVSDDGSQQATITIAPKIEVSNGQELDSKSITVESLEFPDAILSTRNNGKIGVIDIPTNSGTTGIIIDNGTSNVAGVTQLNFPTSEFLAKSPTEVDVIPYVTVSEENGQSVLSEKLVVQPPLKVFADPDKQYSSKMFIDPAAYEPQHAPSFLAYLSDDSEIVGKHGSKKHDGKLWFDNIVVPDGVYIHSERANKSWSIEEADQLDPNVSGGTDYLICYRIHMDGNAPEDGFVRSYVMTDPYNEVEEPTIMLDKDGQPLAYEKHYKAGQPLGAIDIIAVVNAKGETRFSCHVVDSFEQDLVVLTDRTRGCTGLLIQALTSTEKTGLGLLQFENDTNQNIEFSSHYMGVDRMSIQWVLQQDQPIQIGEAGQGQTMQDGLHFYNISRMKLGVDAGHLVFQDDGSDVCDFNFGKIFTAEETQMTVGRDVNISITITDKDSGWEVALMGWDGKPDEYTPEIFKSRTDGVPNFETNWTKYASAFISEDIVSGEHKFATTFTVPAGIQNYAVIIYPVQAQQPLTLKLKQFQLDIAEPYVGYAISAPERLEELHLHYDKEFKQFVQDTQGYASLRYTINNSDTPMPIGIPMNGQAAIVLDPTVNQISGSSAKGGEGAMKFTESGKATIASDVRLWNEQSTDDTVTMWYSTVDAMGQLTKIPESETQFTIKAGAKNVLYSMKQFTIDVEVNDRVALSAKSNKVDGAFLQTISQDKPLLSTKVNFVELVGANDDIDLVSVPWTKHMVVDRRSYEFSNNSDSTITLDLDIPTDVVLANHTLMSRVGERITSEDNTRFQYDNLTKKLIITGVGSISDGIISLEFWG